MNSPDVKQMINSNQNGLRMELFIIKNDNEGGEFYYLGQLNYIENSAKEILKNGDTVVEMLYSLSCPVETKLYDYLTKE